MSTETNTNASPSKKSFMTRVMENVEAKKAAKESGETTAPTPEEIRAKRFLKGMALVVAGTAAVTTALVVISKNMSSEAPENEEETEENDSED